MGSKAKELNAPVMYGGVRMGALEARQRLEAMKGNPLFTTDEAALFLRYSGSTLERWRKDGSGPVYVQAGGEGAKGTNQTVLYLRSELLAWLDRNTVSSSLQAAIKKGQAFATIFDLAEGLPFYVMPDGAIESMVEDNTIDLVISRLGGNWSIMWLTPIEAASRRWSSLGGHQDFAGRVHRALSSMQAAIAQAIEDTDLASSIKG